MRAFLLLAIVCSATACSWLDRTGISALSEEIRGLLTSFDAAAKTYPVLPGPVTTANNAFVQDDLNRPLRELTGNDDSLMDNLGAFARNQSEDMCYWAFQALPPPRGGPSVLHPFRGYWDVTDGHNDQDIEWVQAYGDVAVSRLHSRIKPDGPVVGAMCAMGAQIMTRRCKNGHARKTKCIPAITNATIQWPMAVSIWKVGHPDLLDAVTDWRASVQTGHLPNIEWVAHTKGTVGAYPWNSPLPAPGDLNPAGMPSGAQVQSKDSGWGSPKIAKVVKCSDIPAKFRYHTKVNYECDHMPSSTATVSSVDEAYDTWKSLTGLWPPTKPCKDDLVALNATMSSIAPPLMGANCSTTFAALSQSLTHFSCDTNGIWTGPTFRDMCCSVCGGEPIPEVPVPTPPMPAAPYHCSVCNHVYDAARDGNGTAFEDLPETWKCPYCGAPKAAYAQQPSGEWAHTH